MALSNKIDSQDAHRSLTAWLGEQTGSSDVRVSELEIPTGTGGLSCDAILFEASWTEQGSERAESLVVRVAPPGSDGLFPGYDLEQEALIMRALSEHTDVPAPPVLFTETDHAILGGPFLVMERIEGRVPSDDPPYSKEGWVVELDPVAQRTMLDNAIATVAAVAQADWKGLGLDALSRVGLDQQLSYFEQLYEDGSRGREHAIPEAGLEWLRANAPKGEPQALSWGDARIGNMLFADDGTIAGALDWEVASIGSPEADLGYFLFALRLWSEGFGAPSPPGFPGREQIIARFEELSGHRVKHLDYYETFGAVFGAVMVMRGGYLMIEHGLLPADSPMPVANPASVLLAAYLDLPAPTGEIADWAGTR
jgi:aminoglycoside phosphotransferase (APT) family kinase protein